MPKSSNPALTAFNDLMGYINSGNEKAVKQVLDGQYSQKIINGDPRKGLNNGIPLLNALRPKTGAVNVAIVIALLSITTIDIHLAPQLVALLAAANLSAAETAKINSLLLARGSKTTLAAVAPTLSTPLAKPATSAISSETPSSTPLATPTISAISSATPIENLEEEDYILIASTPPVALPSSLLTSQQSAIQPAPPTWLQWLGLTNSSASLPHQ